jgi:hypothetical protein
MEVKMADELIIVDAIRDDEATLNITWAGQNGDLEDPIPFDAPDLVLRALAMEAVRTGGVPGIIEDINANFEGFVVDRYPATTEKPYNRVFVRPKTAFGKGFGSC